jgi:hypothetical protein
MAIERPPAAIGSLSTTMSLAAFDKALADFKLLA